tara:strand:- start:5185 stop:5835 length:651 start_codon:yes stop_codon:yes gene_type:complete
MASWKEIVTKAPTDTSISSVSIGAANGFSGVLTTANGGLGANITTLDAGLLVKTGTGNNYSSIPVAAGEVMGTSGGGSLQSLSIADSHTHAGLIDTQSDNQVNGDLTINGELSVTALAVTSVAITESADNFITVNSGQAASDGGLEVYLSGVAGNNAKLQWNNTTAVWEMGKENATMRSVAGVVERTNNAWEDTSGQKTGSLGLDAGTGAAYIFLP